MLFYQNRDDYVSDQTKKLENLVDSNILEIGIITKVLKSNEDQDKIYHLPKYSITHKVDYLKIDHLGIIGDRHRGSIKYSGPRERFMYEKGTVIKQNRHIFAISEYDCQVLSDKIGVKVTPELLGANLVIEREDKKPYSLSDLPQNTHLFIASQESESQPKTPIATLIHYAKQQGCGITGASIAEKYKDKDLSKEFVKASKENRGIVCTIEFPIEKHAIIKKGQKVFFKFPTGACP